jgi:hypothetical protein
MDQYSIDFDDLLDDLKASGQSTETRKYEDLPTIPEEALGEALEVTCGRGTVRILKKRDEASKRPYDWEISIPVQVVIDDQRYQSWLSVWSGNSVGLKHSLLIMQQLKASDPAQAATRIKGATMVAKFRYWDNSNGQYRPKFQLAGDNITITGAPNADAPADLQVVKSDFRTEGVSASSRPTPQVGTSPVKDIPTPGAAPRPFWEE